MPHTFNVINKTLRLACIGTLLCVATAADAQKI